MSNKIDIVVANHETEEQFSPHTFTYHKRIHSDLIQSKKIVNPFVCYFMNKICCDHAKSFQGNLVHHPSYLADCYATS